MWKTSVILEYSQKDKDEFYFPTNEVECIEVETQSKSNSIVNKIMCAYQSID